MLRLVARTRRKVHHLRRMARRYRVIARHPFRLFNIELTNECPMKCVMCARTHGMTRDIGYMDFGLFQRVIDEYVRVSPKSARSRELWLHHFGESLTHPAFDTFIRYASDRGVPAALSLNPVMLTEEISTRLLEARPSLLLFSLDGHDDESFLRIRGVKNAYEKSRKNLRRFLEMKRECGSSVKTELSMIAFPDNHESIEQLTASWNEEQLLDAFTVKPFIAWNGDLDEIRNMAPPSAQRTCRYPFRSMTVTWDGAVVPCCYDYDKKYVLGNVKEQTLTEIWNGPKMQGLRREFIRGEVNNSLCVQCPDVPGGPRPAAPSFTT